MERAWALGAALILGVPAAHAYTIETPLSDGCHEMLTADALRAVRDELPAAAPLAATSDERALIDDVQFSVPGDMQDLGGTTLLLGARDNDVKGVSSIDLSQLPLVHGNPNAQREHCLRSPDDDEPDGSAKALADCRAFIHERVADALTGIDLAGDPDPTQRTSLSVSLAVRGHVDAPLPTFYLRMGQAMHALEDGFSHTWRSADQTQITVILDWVEQVDGTLVEARDGPGHARALDACTGLDEPRQHRLNLAREAATALLRTALDPDLTAAEKMTAVDGVLDAYLGFAPGCTFANGWCNAPEVMYADGGCAVARAPSPPAAVFIMAIFGVVIARRRALVPLALIIALATTGLAAEPEQVLPALGLHVAGAGSINNGSLAATLGARLRLSRKWVLGLDGEWNPWVAYAGSTVRAGVVNLYASAIFEIPLADDRFNLRTTASVGASRLLMDLYGAPSGSTGLYLGIAFLGLEWKVTPRLYVVADPLGISLPIPQLHGVPLVYWQYRATFGIEFYTDWPG